MEKKDSGMENKTESDIRLTRTDAFSRQRVVTNLKHTTNCVIMSLISLV